MITPSQLEDFFAYLRFPSVSADLKYIEGMNMCAAWLVQKFTDMGFSTTTSQCGGPPVVLAKRISSPDKKTILIYGHYDVQPVDPLSLWRGKPFEPIIEDGFVVARGATDNKGQTICHILGAEAMLKERGDLPVNLLFVIEGEEEIGSPNFNKFLEAHRAELECDAILISDTSMAAPGYPAITTGLRGIACMEVKVTGAKTDLHSGIFGGAVSNAALVLIQLLNKLHNPDGSISIPGFYEEVIPPTEAERTAWRTIAYTDETILSATGSPKLSGEEGFSAVERTWIRPTAEINGLTSGYQGDGSKTIIPRMASAKLSCRLVPNQKPDQIAEKVSTFLRASIPDTVALEVTYDHGGSPFYADINSPFFRAALNALKEVFGQPAVFTREGLSIPIVSLLQSTLKKDILLIGLGLVDCNAHAPNETFPLEQLEKGIQFHQVVLDQLANT